MTTAEIETYADIGGISSPDLNLKVLLRRNVVPAFMKDVGYTSWRRVVASVSISAQIVSLPNDVELIQAISLSSDSSKLQYIGEDPEKVMAAEAAPSGKPTGYYFSMPGGSSLPLITQIKVNTTPDVTYQARMIYVRTVPWADDTTAVDMNPYIPPEYQWALVWGLKSEIYLLREGIGDPNFVAAEQKYKTFIDRARENKEQARRNFAVFVR